MNRTDIEEMRRRLAARAATDGSDPPWLIAIAGILFAALILIVNFI